MTKYNEMLKDIRSTLTTNGRRKTQRSMADFLGTSQPTYSDMENGKRELPRRDGLLIMALHYLKTHRKLKDFLRWVENNNRENDEEKKK